MAVLRVKEPFAYDTPNGIQRVLRVGDVVDDADPAVKGRLVFFEPVEDAAGRRLGVVVEQATAAPGERRTRSRATHRAKVAKSDDDAED